MDCDSETYRSAEYIDSFLNPLSLLHPSFIKDTYDFIDKIKNITVPTQAFIFTLDVESLYTNIDTEEGLRAVQCGFLRNPDPLRPDEEILKLLQINLSRNDFEFNGKFYLQIKGTAMGKKFAPAYASIFMAAWEEAALQTVPLQPAAYFRFLDDIWGIWTYSLEEFYSFINMLTLIEGLKPFKTHIHSSSVDFLDITTFKGPDFLDTRKLDTKVFF